MDGKTLRVWAIAALLIAIAAMIFIGCGCGGAMTRETFADAAASAEKPADKPAAKAATATDDDGEDGEDDAALSPDAEKAAKDLLDTIEKRAVAKAQKSEAKKKAAETKGGDMTKKEQELFEDLKNNKLSDKEITNLVKTGILNEVLVEKFLAKLDATAAELKLEDAEMREAGKEMGDSRTLSGDAAAAAALATNIEGFCSMAPGFAKW